MEPSARRELGRAHVLEDRRHIGERGGEVGPAAEANQAHGAPIDKDRKQRQQVFDFGPLEQAAEEQHRHAQPFEVLPDRRELVVPGAKNCLFAVR